MSLWKRLICAKYGVLVNNLLWDCQCYSTKFFFVKTVGELFLGGSNSEKILREGIVVVVGNGEKAKFWDDILVDTTALKVAFPRLYALASIKTGCVRDFGSWDGGRWK